MKEIFQKIPVELPKNPFQKRNANDYYILLEVVGMWKKLGQNLPPLMKRKLSKKARRGEGNKEQTK